MNGLLNATVTRVRARPGTDEWGNTVADWAAGDRVDLPARVQQASAGEDTYDRDQQEALFLVFLPPGADVTGHDRLEWAGRVLELVGPPAAVAGYRAVHHIEARAREVTG